MIFLLYCSILEVMVCTVSTVMYNTVMYCTASPFVLACTLALYGCRVRCTLLYFTGITVVLTVLYCIEYCMSVSCGHLYGQKS
jgi:hypothetical protein